jgi:hypothetical protein
MDGQRTLIRAIAARTLLTGVCITVAACTSVNLEESPPYDYASQPVAIVNPDWGVIPLPNNFLNPVKQASIVRFPGMPMPTALPTTMALPIVDAAAAATAQTLGYPVNEDSPLSKALLTGQNRLDGFMTSFAPTIPFSRPLDVASLHPYDGTNAADANFWFVDVTDPAAPVALAPDAYLRIFNWQQRTEMPYTLSLRLPAPGMLSPPADFTPGHTYLVVATGWTDKGIKALATDAAKPSEPFKADGVFLLFAAPTLFPDIGTTYIGTDGGARSGVVTGLAAAQSLEGGRQLTDWALKIWEGLPGVQGAWSRDQVVTAYSFTTATNPMPDYFDPIAAFFGGAAVRPQPSDAVDSTGVLVKADAPCTATLDFTVDKPVAIASANKDTVRLFKFVAGAYTAVELKDVVATNADGKAAVTATPKVDLEANSLYVVAVTNGLTSLDGTRTAVDQTYFGLTRAAYKNVDATTGAVTFVDTPLVDRGPADGLVWQSPYLDSRLDTLILNGTIDPVTPADLAAAGDTVVQILSYLEAMRQIYKPHMDWLVVGNDGKPGNIVALREDLVLVWTFTTGACAQ